MTLDRHHTLAGCNIRLWEPPFRVEGSHPQKAFPCFIPSITSHLQHQKRSKHPSRPLRHTSSQHFNYLTLHPTEFIRLKPHTSHIHVPHHAIHDVLNLPTNGRQHPTRHPTPRIRRVRVDHHALHLHPRDVPTHQEADGGRVAICQEAQWER